MDQIYTAVVLPLMLLVGQTLVALGQRKISQRMDEGANDLPDDMEM